MGKIINPAEMAVTNCIIPNAVRKATGITPKLYNTKAEINKNAALSALP